MEMKPLPDLPLFLEQTFRALSHLLLGHDHLTHTSDFSLYFCDIPRQFFHQQGIDFAGNKPLIGRVKRQAVFPFPRIRG